MDAAGQGDGPPGSVPGLVFAGSPGVSWVAGAALVGPSDDAGGVAVACGGPT